MTIHGDYKDFEKDLKVEDYNPTFDCIKTIDDKTYQSYDGVLNPQ